MASSAEPLRPRSLLQSLVTKCVGKRLKRHATEICLNIKLVDLELKPAYLLDYGVDSADDLLLLLQELGKVNYIKSSDIAVASIGEDYLVLRLSSIRQFCETNFDWTSILIVDISKELDKPCIKKCEDIITSLKNVVQNVRTAFDDVSVIEIDTMECNVSTLFGLLLGYPVLYWYDIKGAGTENCLTLLPLSNYRIEGVFNGDGVSRHMVYSFSVPHCLGEDTSTAVNDWFTKIYEKKSNWKIIFDNIELTKRITQLESVVL